MEYIATVIAVLNDYLEYSLHDNHTVNLPSKVQARMSFMHAAVSIKCCVGKDMIWFSF